MEINHNSNPVKNDKELVRFHKQLLKKYLNDETNLEFRKRSIILELYDNSINDSNIRYYFNSKIKIFLAALLTDRLHEIKSYHPQERITYTSES